MTIVEMYEKRPRKAWLYFIVTAVIISLIVWSAEGVQYKGLAAKGSEVAFGMVYGLFYPDTNLLFSLSTDGVPYLLFQTIAIAILGTIFGAILAVPVSFLASENRK